MPYEKSEQIGEARKSVMLSSLATDAGTGLSFYLRGNFLDDAIELLEHGVDFCVLMEEGRESYRKTRGAPRELFSRDAYETLKEANSKSDELVDKLISEGKPILEEIIKNIKGETKKKHPKEKIKRIRKLFLKVSEPYLTKTSIILSSLRTI